MPFPQVPHAKFTYRMSKDWGQLYWFDFGQATSRQRTFAEPHPALIISDPKVTLPSTVLIVPFTSLEHKRRGYEFHVEVTKADCAGLDNDSVAKVDQIYCIEERHLPDQYFIGMLGRSAMKRIYSKLLKALAFQNVIG